ncbi:MAG: hypothetical protein ACTSRG_09195 [Candidatus Helarchaeota archaeon]
MTKILFEVKKYGRYLHNFPVKKASVGYKLTGKVYSQFIQIILSSDGIVIFNKDNKPLKNIPYKMIKEFKDINVAKKLQMKKGSWDYYWNDYNVIYIDNGKEEIYLLFWSNVAGWQKKLHYKFFNLIQQWFKKSAPQLKKFILEISNEYKDKQIPVSRIKEEFGLDTIDTYRKIEALKDPEYCFEIYQNFVTVKHKELEKPEENTIKTINDNRIKED